MVVAKGGLTKVRRSLRTVYFMVAMVASLVVLSAPVAVAFADILVPYVLVSILLASVATASRNIWRDTHSRAL